MFRTRLLSGIVLVIVIGGAFWMGGPVLGCILYAISMIAYYELTKAMKCIEVPSDKSMLKTILRDPLQIVGYLGITLYYGFMALGGTGEFGGNVLFLLITIAAVFMAHLFVYVLTFPKYDYQKIVASVFAFMYAPVMLSFVALTRGTPQGAYIVWLILISSWGCDTCAYVVGMLIGKKKIFPVLSPKKSLEGCIGGVVGAALIGAIYAALVVEPVYPDRNITGVIAFIAACGAVMSMVGDLAASAVKRNAEVKDYSHLIPGHGGMMDRFDSVIITAPMTYFLTVLMLSIK